MKQTNYAITLRIFHFLIVIYLIACIIYIYYCAFTLTVNTALIIAIFSQLVEGFLIYTNKGNCPLIYVQRKFGDNTPFFDLVLPKKYAKKAVPFFAIISLVGIFALVFRLLLNA